jgi:glycosyltransferase involved in cell wall biosynthesis
MKFLSSKPLITTVIPTYNRSKLLKRAIHSVLYQTYPYLQVCIYDNASEDETAEVVAEIAKKNPRVKYHRHNRNLGITANVNFGIEQVTTPYFSLLSDDDTLLPKFFEDAVNVLESHPEAAAFIGQIIGVNEKGEKIGVTLRHWKNGLVSPPDGLIQILEKGCISLESVLFRSEVINSVGLLNPSFGGSGDYDFMMRVAKMHILYVLKKPYAIYLNHDGQFTAKRDINEFISTGKKIFEQWLRDPELSGAVKERIKKKSKANISHTLSNYIYHNCIIGEDTEAITKATEIMKKEFGFAFRPLRAIIVARIANYNRFLKRIVKALIDWYMQYRRVCIF